MHPEKIGAYRIEKKIGAGGMGNVYLGTHEESGEEAAVKVLPASMAREAGFVARFSREIHALRQLTSPYIVKLFDDGETEDGTYYYAMEYVEGETLTSMVSHRKRIPWQEVIDITLDIAAALKAAHVAGIIHRDLKPSNLMVAKDGDIKLTDFGVAHVFATTRLTKTGGVVGTAEYMSPEQAQGKRATRQSDLYSLGAVMYVMLTGRPPFTGRMAADIMHQHQFAQFDKPSHYAPDLPPPLEALVCKLLEKQPDKRYPDAMVVMRQLEITRAKVLYAADAAKEEQTRIAHKTTVKLTVSGAIDQTSSGEKRDAHAPGPATMVRNVLRQDLDDQLRKSAVAKFFDNTLVLILLFLFVIGLGFYLMKASEPDPREQLALAEDLMRGKAGRAWLTARDDILQPLIDSDALPDEFAKIRKMISRADQYDFCRRLQISRSPDGSSESEIERLIRQAFDRYADGQVGEACADLEAIQFLISDNDRYEYLSEFVEEALEGWNREDDVDGRRSLLSEIIETAMELHSAEDRKADAIRHVDYAIELYGDDRSVTQQLQRCYDLRRAWQDEDARAVDHGSTTRDHVSAEDSDES